MDYLGKLGFERSSATLPVNTYTFLVLDSGSRATIAISRRMTCSSRVAEELDEKY
jgi:hypothetical protein